WRPARGCRTRRASPPRAQSLRAARRLVGNLQRDGADGGIEHGIEDDGVIGPGWLIIWYGDAKTQTLSPHGVERDPLNARSVSRFGAQIEHPETRIAI